MDSSNRGIDGNDALARMDVLLAGWAPAGDKREVFLSCYRMMTRNMQTKIEDGFFLDAEWVSRLLTLFSGYYFSALAEWEQDPVTAPRVWQIAHEQARVRQLAVWQHLILGVNAHINYDLVLAVTELLAPEWAGLEDAQKQERYEDYCRVNAVIAETIDEVQDRIIAPELPLTGVLDRFLGRLDELLISRIISSWRDRTWLAAMQLLETSEENTRDTIITAVETETLGFSEQLCGGKRKG